MKLLGYIRLNRRTDYKVMKREMDEGGDLKSEAALEDAWVRCSLTISAIVTTRVTYISNIA